MPLCCCCCLSFFFFFCRGAAWDLVSLQFCNSSLYKFDLLIDWLILTACQTVWVYLIQRIRESYLLYIHIYILWRCFLKFLTTSCRIKLSEPRSNYNEGILHTFQISSVGAFTENILKEVVLISMLDTVSII